MFTPKIFFWDQTQPQEVGFCWLQGGLESPSYNAYPGTMVQMQQVAGCSLWFGFEFVLTNMFFFFSAGYGSYFHEGWYQNSLGFVTGAWPIKGWTVVPQWTTETLDLQRHGHLHLYPLKHTWSWTAIVSHLGKKCQGFISEQFVTTGCIIRIWEQLGIYAALAPSPESFFYFSTGQGAPPFHFF